MADGEVDVPHATPHYCQQRRQRPVTGPHRAQSTPAPSPTRPPTFTTARQQHGPVLLGLAAVRSTTFSRRRLITLPPPTTDAAGPTRTSCADADRRRWPYAVKRRTRPRNLTASHLLLLRHRSGPVTPMSPSLPVLNLVGIWTGLCGCYR